MLKTNTFVLKVNVPHDFNEFLWLFWKFVEYTRHLKSVQDLENHMTSISIFIEIGQFFFNFQYDN